MFTEFYPDRLRFAGIIPEIDFPAQKVNTIQAFSLQ